VEDALEALAILAARPVIPMWTRLASDRERELSLLGQYRDALAASGSASRWRYRLLAAEKHLDLYGSTPETVLELRTIALEADPMRRAMAMSMLAGLPDTPGDSSRALYEEILALADSSDLAGRVEAILGLPPGPSADFRPGAVIETAWNELEAGRAPEAFNRLERLLSTPWSYETRAEALWVSYLAADASGKEHTVLESRLRELVRYYPETREGVQAALRLNVPVGGFQDDGEEP